MNEQLLFNLLLTTLLFNDRPRNGSVWQVLSLLLICLHRLHFTSIHLQPGSTPVFKYKALHLIFDTKTYKQIKLLTIIMSCFYIKKIQLITFLWFKKILNEIVIHLNLCIMRYLCGYSTHACASILFIPLWMGTASVLFSPRPPSILWRASPPPSRPQPRHRSALVSSISAPGHTQTHKGGKKRGCMIRTGDRTRGRWNKNKTPPHRLLLSRIVKAVRVYTKPPTSVSRSLFKLVITAILGGSHSADEVMHPTGLCELWNDLICAPVDRSSWCG